MRQDLKAILKSHINVVVIAPLIGLTVAPLQVQALIAAHQVNRGPILQVFHHIAGNRIIANHHIGVDIILIPQLEAIAGLHLIGQVEVEVVVRGLHSLASGKRPRQETCFFFL